MTGTSYADLVNYDNLDPVKRQAMNIFSPTLINPERLRIRVMPIGESGTALDFLDYDFMLGFNVEGLGTKNRICDIMYKQMIESGFADPHTIYRSIGQCTAAMSVMDLVSCGADPFVYADFLTAGSDEWFKDEERNKALLQGYFDAAMKGGFAIPCGETPALPGIVNPDTLVLEGGSVGLIKPKSRFSYGQKIREGDIICGLPSNGIAANGVSKARKIAEKLPDGYFTKLPSGTLFGDALLVPTPIYVKSIIEMFDEAGLHYVSPITGHAWKKIGRARQPFTYVVDNLPEVPEVFRFMIEVGRANGFDVSDKENYYVWNMGTMVALIAPKDSESTMREIAQKHGTELQVLGHVEKGDREVRLVQKDITFTP